MSKVHLEFRSDTFTKPSKSLLEAMMAAEVGDDCYGEDPTVNEFEKFAADFVGKEAALLMPTCTMSNLTAITTHCSIKFSEYIVGDKQHIYRYEVGGGAAVAGAHPFVIPNNADGTLSLETIESSIRVPDIHFPTTRVICLENTVNGCGGRVLSLEYMKAVGDIAKKHNLKVHLDGARMFNAIAALKTTPKEFCENIDSLSICFSKGLGAPFGACLVGSKEFIDQARRIRKAYGGGMRQSGIIAASAMYCLKNNVGQVAADNNFAYAIATGLDKITVHGGKIFEIIGGVEGVETNIFFFKFKDNKVVDLQRIMKEKYGIHFAGYGTEAIRMVTHCDVDPNQLGYVLQSFEAAANELFAKN